MTWTRKMFTTSTFDGANLSIIFNIFSGTGRGFISNLLPVVCGVKESNPIQKVLVKVP
jgi:hypothetical protein